MKMNRWGRSILELRIAIESGFVISTADNRDVEKMTIVTGRQNIVCFYIHWWSNVTKSLQNHDIDFRTNNKQTK